MRAPITDKHLLEMMWERFPEIMGRGVGQPAQQKEPVAWMIWTHGPVLVFMNKDEANMEVDRLNHAYPEPARMLVPLYTSPPAQRTWVGLTDEEANKIYKDGRTFGEMMRMVEAKLKAKNSP